MSNEEKKQSLDEWMTEERARLEKGFKYEPKPTAIGGPSTGDDVLAGLGLGAAVVGGAVAPHPNPVTFAGCKAAVIVNALRAEIPDDDTRVQVNETTGSVVVTILQSQKNRPHEFSPALAATLIEKSDTLTVSVSDLDQDTVRTTLGSIGSTVLDQGKKILSGRKSAGVAGLLDAAGHVVQGVEDLVEDIQDMGLPQRVWKVIDRVGEAAEQAYLDEQRAKQELQWKQQAARRAYILKISKM